MELRAKQSAAFHRRGFQSDQPVGEIPCPEFIENMMMADQEHDEDQQQ